MNYENYITAVTDELDIEATVVDSAAAEPTSVTAFNALIPRSIEYVENRMQRDLDLINTYVTDETGLMTPNSRNLVLPSATGTFIVVTQVYPIIAGVRQVPLLETSLEYLNWAYPSDVALSPAPSIPAYWAPFNGTQIKYGPAPSSAFGVGIVGTQRFDQLSSTNISNFLTTQLPDAYLAAAMVFWFGWQRDYGAQSDDPKAAMSWEQQYRTLMAPAMVEECRKKFQSSGWSARLPSPVATPAQT